MASGYIVTPTLPPGLAPAQILKPSPESWPTFHGDYSGRHYSSLDQINKANVKSLSLAWTSRLNTSLQGAIIGGKGPEPAPGAVLNANIKATPLIVNGMLYLATPNNAYALDARTGALRRTCGRRGDRGERGHDGSCSHG